MHFGEMKIQILQYEFECFWRTVRLKNTDVNVTLLQVCYRNREHEG